MAQERKEFRLDIKEWDAELGTFTGYAATYDKDSGGDRILPGAFSRSLHQWAEKGRKVPILWQHRTDNPIGITEEIAEDAVGLKVRGRLILDVQQAREAYALIKEGALGGLSIGYDVIKKDYDKATGTRLLKELRLWEYSLVSYPMNEAARLLSVKSGDAIDLRSVLVDLNRVAAVSRKSGEELEAEILELIDQSLASLAVLRGTTTEAEDTARSADASSEAGTETDGLDGEAEPEADLSALDEILARMRELAR